MGPKRDHKAWNEDLVRALRYRYNNAVTAKTASGSNMAGDVAKVQVTEGKQTQFRYLAAIEKIEAVGKDIYTFANGRIINLPGTEKIGGKAALPRVAGNNRGTLHVRMHRTRFNPHAGDLQSLSTPNASGSSAARILWSRFPGRRVRIAHQPVVAAMAEAVATAPIRNRNGQRNR
jgi:hypothetical protein